MNPVLQKKLKRNSLAIAALLIIPLVLTLLNKDPNDGWRWGPGDFVFAFLVTFFATVVYELIALRITKNHYRLILAGVITLAVCILWVEVATDGVSRAIAQLLG